jgi:hypothetical protein
MLQGVAACRCKPLKHNRNGCDKVRQETEGGENPKILILLATPAEVAQPNNPNGLH